MEASLARVESTAETLFHRLQGSAQAGVAAEVTAVTAGAFPETDMLPPPIPDIAELRRRIKDLDGENRRLRMENGRLRNCIEGIEKLLRDRDQQGPDSGL
ncbi:hypothetical protein ABW21_db0203779 [Orbilia brochopaga]|nr:hypothetical protein ABW21_db0203779 [Drechslerella brochopaga]